MPKFNKFLRAFSNYLWVLDYNIEEAKSEMPTKIKQALMWLYNHGLISLKFNQTIFKALNKLLED